MTIPRGIPRLDAAVAEAAERITRRQWAANVARFKVAGMGYLSLDDPEATPEKLSVVFLGCEDVIRDLSLPESYDGAKRMLAGLLGWPETARDRLAWFWGQRDGDHGWMLWDHPGIYCAVIDFAPCAASDDPRAALISALVAVAGREA